MFSRSRTRSWAVRSRRRMVASSGEAESRISPASSTVRSIRARSWGASSRSACAPMPRCVPFQSTQARGEEAGGAQRLGDLEQVRGGQPAPAPGSLQRLPHVARPADARLRLLGQQARRLVGLVVQQPHVDGVGQRDGRLGQLARRREGGQRGELLDDRRELQRAQRTRVGGRAGRRSLDRGRSGHRSGHESQRPGRPFAGVRHADARRAHEARPATRLATRRIGPASRSAPFRRRSMPKAAARLPGPCRQPSRRERRRAAREPAPRPRPARARAQQDRLGLARRGRRPRWRSGASRTRSRRTGARVARTSTALRGVRPRAEWAARSSGPEVRLHLDDAPGDPPLGRVMD